MENIIFDFGGVLLEWDSDYFYLPYFGSDKSKMNKFYDETNIKDTNKKIDRGVSFDLALRDLMIKFPQYEEPIKLWKNAWHKMLGKKIEGSLNILYTLKSKGYQLYGLTNWSSETFPYVYYTHDFFHIFQDIVVSGRVGLIKPEPEIYTLCLNRNNLDPKQSVFIDDNIENVISAESVGIKGIHFKSSEQLHKDLTSIGVCL